MAHPRRWRSLAGALVFVALALVPAVASQAAPGTVTPAQPDPGTGRLITETQVNVTRTGEIPEQAGTFGPVATTPAGPGGPAEVTAQVAATSFTGLAQIASGNGQGYPPDTNIARGPNRVIEVTNRRIRLFDTNGGVFATSDLNTFFGASGDLLFDPKILFDRASSTYFAVALQGTTTSSSNLYLAVSRPVDPTSLSSSAQWCRYVYDARLNFGSVPTWADYPGLGVGANTLVVTVNNFSASSAFQGTAIRAWSKGYYANNTNACPAFQGAYFWGGFGSPAQALPYTLSPTQHYTNPTGVTGATSPVYLVDAPRGGSPSYRLWKVANLSTGSPLLFGPTTVNGNRSINDPAVLAPGGANGIGIDPGTARIGAQVAGLGNALYVIHAVDCQFGAGAREVCIRYIRFGVSNGAGGALAGSVGEQSVFGGGAGWYYWHPSIAVTSTGAAATAFNSSSVGGFRGSAWATKPSNSAAFGSATWLAQGTCLLNATLSTDGTKWRSGDYSGAATDPDLSSIWVASERSQNLSGVGCGWQTHIARLTGL